MTMGHNCGSVKLFRFANLSQKKTPASAGVLRDSVVVAAYSFKEFGSDVFFGDLRFR